MRQRFYDVEFLLNLNKEQKKQIYKSLRLVANKRISRLEAAGLYEQSIAFKYGIERFTAEYSDHNYLKLLNFINKKTSTVYGVRRKNKWFEDLATKFGMKKDKSYLLERFLRSYEYKLLQYKYPSEDVIEAFTFLADTYDDYETIMRYIEDYISNQQFTRKKRGRRIL